MSDAPQADDWWQASDGKWYPPEAAQQQHPPPSYPGSPAGGGQSMDAKGFLASLYDFKFDHFVTPKLIRFFYALFVIILSLVAVVFLLAGLASGEGATIVLAIIFVPIAYLVYLVLIRIYFELVALLFRVGDDLRAIRRSKGL